MEELSNIGWNLYLYGRHSAVSTAYCYIIFVRFHSFIVLRTENQVWGCKCGWIFGGEITERREPPRVVVKSTCKLPTDSWLTPELYICRVKLQGGQREIVAIILKTAKKVQQLPALRETELPCQRGLVNVLGFLLNLQKYCILGVKTMPQD